MLRLTPAQVHAAAAHSSGAFESHMRESLRKVHPEAPCFASGHAWSEWWSEAARSGDRLGADDHRTLGLHALLTLVAGTSYLDDPALGWLTDLLTDGSRHAPTYREIGDDFTAVAQAVEEALQDRSVEMAR